MSDELPSNSESATPSSQPSVQDPAGPTSTTPPTSDSSSPTSSSFPESPSTSNSDNFPPQPSYSCTTPYTPSYTPPYTPPNERSSMSSSDSNTITDVPPPPTSSSSAPDPPPSSTSSTMATVSVSVTVAPPPPPSSSTSASASNSGMRDPEDPPSTSSTSMSSSESSTSPPPSSSSSSQTSNVPGVPDDVSTSSSSSAPPPPGSSSSVPPDPGNSSSTSVPVSSPDRGGPSESSPAGPAPTDGGQNTPPAQPTSMGDGSPTEPMTTLSTAVTFTTTNADGSVILTVPTQFTTVVVTTLPGGTFTTFTEVVANPPGVLNPGGSGGSADRFFQNKGAVAGVFIAASLAVVAIVLFVIFALRRRRSRVQNERDAEFAAGLAAAVSNQRFGDDEDHPVVMRNVPSAMRGRSPWPEDEDDDRLVYGSSTAPFMYSSLHGVGPPTQNMIIAPEAAYPATPGRYALARTASESPSPKRELQGLPTTNFEPASPTANSGWSSHPEGAYLGRRSDSVSPAPTHSASASAYHGTRDHGTSVGHAPPSSFAHRPPPSVGKDGSGTGSGSGGTSAPSLVTAGGRTQRASSPTLEDIYPPQYEHFSRPASSAAQFVSAPQVGFAYEPSPVLHNHQIVTDLSEVQGAYDGMRSPFSADIGNMSVASRSMYSREDESEEGDHVAAREDSRLDPMMRMRDGLASAVSIGPRDHEDYTRRVAPQLHSAPSTASHSHSMHQSHSTH